MNGLTLRKQPPDEQEVRRYISLYQEGFTVKNIAERFGRNPQVVSKWLKEKGVDIVRGRMER